jgi:transposase-like protein
MVTASAPKSLQQAIIFFSRYENCHAVVSDMRWPNGVVKCPHCGSENVTYLENARRWKCYAKHAKPQFSLKVGTIFEDSPIGLEKWLPALWLVTNCKNGISSYELARALEVTQKTAWFMLSRLRLALQAEDGGKLSGDVEIDETYIGGRARNMSRSRKARMLGGKRGGVAGKAAVMGLLDRHGKDAVSQVRTVVLSGRKRGHIQPEVRKHVETGTAIYTDALMSYDGLSSDYTHGVIDHAERYVDGQVHTNGLENFWSLLKRALKGTYVAVEPFHLFRYLDEQAFRFNNRGGNDAFRFAAALNGIIGKRLTYSALIGSELPQTC